MSDNKLKIQYKLYLEAEDVSQSRILSCASYLENALQHHTNPYISCAEIDNESDLDEFEVRLYVDEVIEEEHWNFYCNDCSDEVCIAWIYSWTDQCIRPGGALRSAWHHCSSGSRVHRVLHTDCMFYRARYLAAPRKYRAPYEWYGE